MNGLLEWLPMTLVRTTLVTSVAATAALVLLRLLRINRPEVHRTVWLLVVLQGWMLAVWTWELEGAPLPSARPAAAPAMDIATTVTPATRSGLAPPVPIGKVNWQAVVRQGQVALWVGGAAVLLVIGSRRYWRLARGPLGEPVDRDDWRTEWRETLGDSKVARAELRITQTLGPLVCWVPWTYRVLAPRELWTRLEPRERLLVLRHELAHCERGDLWKNLLVRLLALPQWFNPLVWVAVRRFEEAGEWACDERVADQSGATSEYAQTLVTVAELVARAPGGAVAATGGELSRRVKRVINTSNVEGREMRGYLLAVLLVAVGMFQVIRVEHVAADEAPDRLKLEEAADDWAAAWWDETEQDAAAKPEGEVPKSKWSFDQPYVIEPPDVLLINLVKIIPKGPHKIEVFDGLLIRAIGVDDAKAPIADAFFVGTDGQVDLGPAYGKVKLVGLTLEEAKDALLKHLSHLYAEVELSVSLAVSAGGQEIAGEHLVGPDGRVNLGTYGTVYVTGLTIAEATEKIEKQLAEKLQDPRVTVDVFSYNSKKYYIISRGGERGDQIVQMRVTGNETVLDALAAVGGVARVKQLWVDRPGSATSERERLEIDLDALLEGRKGADHRLLPGDRVFIDAATDISDSRLRTPGGSRPTERQGRTEEADDAMRAGLEYLKQRQPIDLPPYLPPTAAYQAAPVAEGATKTTVRFVSDPKSHLRDTAGLEPAQMATGDTRILLGLMKVLESNNLVEVLAAPSVVAAEGAAASVRIGSPGDLMSVETTSHHVEGGVAEIEVRARLETGHIRQFDTAVRLREGQSALICWPKKPNPAGEGDLYLLVSRGSPE